METAKIFENGRSQAVRLPKKFRFNTDEVIVQQLDDPKIDLAFVNGNFILMHSVGSIPHGTEIDVPLNYADYYFLEALKRKRDIEEGTR
jgi:hypothetical protein